MGIKSQPAVPTSNKIHSPELLSVAQTAAFHFVAIAQEGSSLYNSLMIKVSDLNVLVILASIGPGEAYHAPYFKEALEGIVGLEVPEIRPSPIFEAAPTGDK